MNTKTEKQIADIKSQTIGVEIEMNNITRMDAAKLAAEFFGTHRYADTHRINGYYTWSAWDARGREWKFQRDVSIAGDDAHKCEMVTPILTYADIETLQELCRKLREIKAFVYIMHEDREPALPRGEYVNTCARGYQAFNFNPEALRRAIARTKELINERR